MIIQKIHFSTRASWFPQLSLVPFVEFVFETSTESRFSTYTVSTFTSVFVRCTAIASRSLYLSLSVTVVILRVSPCSFSRTTMVTVSMIVSCTATITCSTLTLSRCSAVTLLTSCVALTCRLAEHAEHPMRTVSAITAAFLKLFQFICQLVYFFT